MNVSVGHNLPTVHGITVSRRKKINITIYLDISENNITVSI